MEKKTLWFEIAKFTIPLLIAGGVAWGTMKADLNNMRQDVDTLQKDHDSVVAMREQIKNLSKNLDKTNTLTEQLLIQLKKKE